MVRQVFRGIFTAIRAHKAIAFCAALAIAAFNLLAPVVILSIARKPADFFTFNPWLPRLPAYLTLSEPFLDKLAFLSQLKVAWVSADGPDGPVWAFILDVPTLARIACFALLFGAYFALWAHHRKTASRAGIFAAATSVFGLTTCPCSLAGTGAPVLPLLGLAFTGVSAGTLALFAAVSRISIALVVGLLSIAIVWLGLRAGKTPLQAREAQPR
ncbi:MAG TPA: hypothetical protein VGH20_11145 [Myxococcales bacterium]|jgi:hypothetical protein